MYGKKGLAHRPAPGEAGGEGQGEACAQVPGIPPAEDRDVPAADLPALGIEAPDAALVAGDLIAELGGAEGQGRAGGQGRPVSLLRQGQEEALAIAEVEVVLPIPISLV